MPRRRCCGRQTHILHSNCCVSVYNVSLPKQWHLAALSILLDSVDLQNSAMRIILLCRAKDRSRFRTIPSSPNSSRDRLIRPLPKAEIELRAKDGLPGGKHILKVVRSQWRCHHDNQGLLAIVLL